LTTHTIRSSTTETTSVGSDVRAERDLTAPSDARRLLRIQTNQNYGADQHQGEHYNNAANDAH